MPNDCFYIVSLFESYFPKLTFEFCFVIPWWIGYSFFCVKWEETLWHSYKQMLPYWSDNLLSSETNLQVEIDVEIKASDTMDNMNM